ncbi:Superfamily II DNA or RNA helicase, SNF2 family [Paenibacillus sp. yr247]|uniref:DEAD/DEAH box helicase n=1 Tax=Paenibacillus sp. yr247 TaxID=1761880 RepID=UPI0008899EEE|nr:DEAD/DEAH box helicase [Paenibacillus sp. yr247]SDN61709.1 Superfamily II DNA or RNA helicase, SNF2 family [Paenibacillus sp. yr247]
MFFFKKKQNELHTSVIPIESGIRIAFHVSDGKQREDLIPPLTKDQIEQHYRSQGFNKYIAWEELYDSGALIEGVLPYDTYYEMLNDPEGTEVLSTVSLPTQEMQLTGELKLDSLPAEAKLSMHLMEQSGKNLDRIGRNYGAIYEVEGQLHLLPRSVYELKKALAYESYEEAYQKIAVCQRLAKEAGLNLDSFLVKEKYHVIDEYNLNIKVHSNEHIELIPIGTSERENDTLLEKKPLKSFADGDERERFVRTGRISEDLSKLFTKRHITGEDVPLFLENPAAVLPEHNYLFDLDAFSDRVRGILPIQKVRQRYTEGGKFDWFDQETGDILPLDEALLKDLMEQNPNQQYVNYQGNWIYLDPTLRKLLLESKDQEQPLAKTGYYLDIIDNEEVLDYSLEAKKANNPTLYPLPGGVKADLFDHQYEGYQWLCQLEEQGRGGLLADDMGLGKTIQVISFLLKQKEKGKLSPTLLVLPIALIENWQVEINKFAPELSDNNYVHHGSNRLRSSDLIAKHNLILTSYDTLKTDQLIFGKIPFQAVICDEAQNIKSYSSQRSRALRAMQSDFRLAMTGTPVENGLDELWSIMDFVQPGCLGSLKEFKNKYEMTQNYEGLLRAIKPYYMRRTKKQVLSDRLPKKLEQRPIYVEASPLQKSISNSMLQTKETGQVAILNMLTKLRQLYGHPGAIISSYEALEDLPKLNEVLSILDRVKKLGEKAIIFTEFRKIHSILKRILMQRYGISVPIIDGDTTNRQSVVQMFNQNPGFGVMLLSQKAAGVGLTITSANHVLHYTRWWNPAVENQATDRAYRIGQQKDVYVYHIITKDPTNFPNGTVEELMHELLESKRELAENVIVPFDTSEIKRLLIEKLAPSE